MTTPDDPYGTPPPGDSGSQPPSFEKQPPPPPQYAAPPPAYGAPPPQYGAPAPGGFGAPPPQYGAPQYGAPQYGAPSPYGGGWSGAPLAEWISRVGATLLDAIIIAIPVIILVSIGAAIGGGGGSALIILGYLIDIAFFIWNYVVRQGSTGQTIGKSVLKIKVVREQDGQVLGAGPCFVRQLAHIIDGIACYIGYLWPLWDDKKQTFADKLCNTVVIQSA